MKPSTIIAIIAATATVLASSRITLATTPPNIFAMPAGQTSAAFVPVGDAGNSPDPATGYGQVNYSFQMGEYDITAGQYTAFLNAVASTDPYGLYSSNMANGEAACGITQTGTVGHYLYTTISNPNFPVNYVSWGDAARLCNWLSNGQPATGVEDATTTEDGSYTLNGITYSGYGVGLMAITRNAGAKYVIPTEDEWYKAAYFKGGGTNAGYWAYPTQSNIAPNAVLPSAQQVEALGGSANFNTLSGGMLTPVGAYSESPGPYGTYDQGGDVWQWIDGIWNESSLIWRPIRGDAFNEVSFPNPAYPMDSVFRTYDDPTNQSEATGFRIAEIPEPASLAILAIGAAGLFRRGRRRR